MLHRKLFPVFVLILVFKFSVSVRPIPPGKQGKLEKISAATGNEVQKSEKLKLESGCPDRCVCFETIVRCMFLKIRKIPEIPANTTNL